MLVALANRTSGVGCTFKHKDAKLDSVKDGWTWHFGTSSGLTIYTSDMNTAQKNPLNT